MPRITCPDCSMPDVTGKCLNARGHSFWPDAGVGQAGSKHFATWSCHPRPLTPKPAWVAGQVLLDTMVFGEAAQGPPPSLLVIEQVCTCSKALDCSHKRSLLPASDLSCCMGM